MKEFMFFIRKRSNSGDTLSPDVHEQFLKSCERYIDALKGEGKLISAQPIDWKGGILARNGSAWTEAAFSESGEVLSGYYHIRAKDLAEAMAIAKLNPEFEFNPQTRIEVRPAKMKEETTGFVYPNQ